MNGTVVVKQETVDAVVTSETNRTADVSKLNSIIAISTGSSGSDSSEDSGGLNDFTVESIFRKIKKKGIRDMNDGEEGGVLKKPKIEDCSVVLPIGFLDPLPPEERMALSVPDKIIPKSKSQSIVSPVFQGCKQFWKAGDYEGGNGSDYASNSVGMDHVRVHPKFLHSNATSHKWALGAFAELLDNSLDEVRFGATYVKVDMLINKKDSNKMLLVKDNGGGMNPDKMRQCMSLGYSEKSKFANTIGQYGNGFKTSTMRLGADVIVFSRCLGEDGMSPTQSIGMLSYTFLRSTGKEDIVVPIVDYVKRGREWKKIIRKSPDDWDKNLETLVQWSPYVSEEELIKQFDFLKDQGTRIVIYNLWEDDQGQLELDFDTDTNDIQIRGVNRDEKKIEMAKKYPNSRHFLTYRHSLRSYASILYLRLPPGFRIILRGIDVDHHNLVNDMMMIEKITYKPVAVAGGMPNDSNMVAIVTIGFVKDAEDHIDIQGFNVYHKNRLIKPFWRVWNAAGSDGRGVIGVLEANFVEPAHDKQGFERTTVLSRLEARLVGMQKQYWSTKCQEIGYAPRRNLKKPNSSDRESPPSDKEKSSSQLNHNGRIHSNEGSRKKSTTKLGNQSPPPKNQSEDDPDYHETRVHRSCSCKAFRASGGTQQGCSSSRTDPIASCLYKGADSGEDRPIPASSSTDTLIKLKEENRQLRERLERKSESKELQFERDRCKSLEIQLQEAQRKLEELDKEQEALINIFQEERDRRDEGEQNMRKRLEDASNTIEELVGKVKLVENKRVRSYKVER